MVVIGHEVSGWENSQVVHISQNLACQSFNLTNPLNLVPKNSPERHVHHAKLGKSRPHPHEHGISPLKVDVIALKLDVHQVIEQVYHEKSPDLDAS